MARNQSTNKKAYHHGDLRAELLRAAEAVLEENGIEAFSLRAVAKRAGVSHGAPAHHFTDVNGFLTALATIGYERFIETQNARQRSADADPRAQLAASGLGYIDFALESPALFQLMFSSQKPDKSDKSLAAVADAAFDKLVQDIGHVHNSNPRENPAMMRDVMSAWAIVHGLADLMIAGRTVRALQLGDMNDSERDDVLSDLILRSIGK